MEEISSPENKNNYLIKSMTQISEPSLISNNTSLIEIRQVCMAYFGDGEYRT
jgi:hypothetical protein